MQRNHNASIGISKRYVLADGRIDVELLKRETSISSVASEFTALRRGGGAEASGLCPLHDERTPSFHVNESLGLFYCYGCRRGGDVIDLRRECAGETFAEACIALAGGSAAGPVTTRATDLTSRSDGRTTSAFRALSEWREGRPPDGTPVEAYLLSRGLGGPIPGSIRYGLTPRFWKADGTPWIREPAMLAALQDGDGKLVGVQRTFLTKDGRKSPIGRPRLALGRTKGAAVRLGPVKPEIMLAVGVEDALALRIMFAGATVWAVAGDANLPLVQLPAGIAKVVVCGDADASGRAAVAAAREALEAQGIRTDELFPKAGAKDFNEEWVLLHG